MSDEKDNGHAVFMTLEELDCIFDILKDYKDTLNLSDHNKYKEKLKGLLCKINRYLIEKDFLSEGKLRQRVEYI